MKKNIMLLAAGAMLLMGGCSKSEIDEGSLNATNAISFEASSNKATKASAVTNANVEDYKFGVFAYYTKDVKWASFTPGSEPNFMNNEEVYYDDTYGWIYDPVKYWPNTTGEMISFFGYLPFSDATTATIGTNGVPVIEFTQTMTAENMEDLTVAKALDKTKTTGAVSLPFKHVLSRLNFAARVDHDLVEDDGTSYGTQVFIKGLRILGTEVNMKVENPNDVVAANAASKFYNAASYTMSADADDNGSWDYTTTPTQQGEALEATSLLAASTQSVTDTNYSSESVVIASNGDATSLLTAGQYLFLIPPSENGVENESDVVLQVDYDVVTKDGSLTDSDKHFISSSTATLSMPNGSIKEGVAYNVVMTIGLNEVKLAANSTLWGTEEDAYTVVAGEAQSAEEIATKIQTALNGSKDAVIAYNQATSEPLDIDLLDLNADSDKSITLNLLHQTGPVSITTHADYKGNITINAPNATVTIDGGTYYNPTVATAPTTLVIAKDAIVEGLTITKGNVVVYGVLNGEVVRSMDNTDTTTTITFMLDSTNGITNDSADDDITINDVPTAAGVYYSVDGGAWTILNKSDVGNSAMPTGKTLNVITVGDNTYFVVNHGVSHRTEVADKGFVNVDLSGAKVATSDNTYFDEFKEDAGLESIKLPSGITTLSRSAFNGCTSLAYAELPESLITISDKAFCGCTSLLDITLPNKVANLGNSAFESCANLKSINLDNITHYGTSVFLFCSNLNIEVELNADVPANLFHSCSSISKLTLGENVTSIGDRAFYGTKNLDQHLTIPASVTYIGTYAFNRSGITGVTILEGNNTLTYGSSGGIFAYSKATSFNFPNNVTELSSAMFSYTQFTELLIPSYIKIETTGSYVFSGIQTLKKLKVENGSTDLNFPKLYFDNLRILEEVDLPSNTKSLGDLMFHGNKSLHTFICRATTPPTACLETFGRIVPTNGDNAYVGNAVANGTPKILYVPQNCSDSYEADTDENYWKTILIDECGFEIKELNADGTIPSDSAVE